MQAFLNELTDFIGYKSFSGKVSFVSQDPWIFSGTVRFNILFGEKFNKERYDKVIEVCGLGQDIKLWDKGDFTMVGDRGIKLSGGQKVTYGNGSLLQNHYNH